MPVSRHIEPITTAATHLEAGATGYMATSSPRREQNSALGIEPAEQAAVISAFLELWASEISLPLQHLFRKAAESRHWSWLPESAENPIDSVAAAIRSAIQSYGMASTEELSAVDRDLGEIGGVSATAEWPLQVITKALNKAVTPLATLEFKQAITRDAPNQTFHPNANHAEAALKSYVALRNSGSTPDPW